MQTPQNSHHDSKTDGKTVSYTNEENVDIYTLDDLIETLEEVATHLITDSMLTISSVSNH